MTFRLILCLLVLPLFLTTKSEAQAEKLTPVQKKHETLDTNKALEFTYSNPSWNRSSTEIDTGSIILRNKSTGQIVQLELQESAPDSGVFEGIYVISWATNGNMPEIYSANDPKKNISKDVDIKTLIDSGAIIRKPFIVTKDNRGLQNLDVYESREEAEKALSQYQDSISPDGGSQPVPTATKQALEAAKLAKQVQDNKKLEGDANRREGERKQIEDTERQKAAERIREQQALDEESRKHRQLDAKAHAEAAMDFYRLGQFKKAANEFEKAVELDPQSKFYYYQFGVTLYRIDSYNRSLVFLKLAEGKTFDPIERDFYLGLNYYKLKEYKSAVSAFKRVEATKQDPLGPSASFYLGLVHFAGTKYDEAKDDFQRTMDTSNDPKLDERSEDYIEKIERLLYFERNKAKKFIFDANFSPQYDSNVLLAPDVSSVSNPSDEASLRYDVGGSLQYRPIYDTTYEFGAKAKLDYLYTAKTELAIYDTVTYDGYLPFAYKGLVFGKGIKLELTPGYEQLYLGQDAGGAPKSYLSSTLLDSLNTIIVDDSWFASLNIKYRNDVFKDTPTSNANKTTLGISNTLFFNKNKTKASIFDLAYTTNSAQADSSKYTKADFGFIYLTPWVWDMEVIAGLAMYLQSYALQNPARTDTNLTGSVSLARPIVGDWLKAMLNTAYISNTSNITSNSYKKYIIGLNIAAEYQF